MAIDEPVSNECGCLVVVMFFLFFIFCGVVAIDKKLEKIVTAVERSATQAEATP